MKFCNRFWTVFKLICLFLVIIQTFLSTKNNFFEGKTVTSSIDKRLYEVEFPITFNIIVTPGFDSEKLREHGFNDSFSYYSGHGFNKSVVGWAGNMRNVAGKFISIDQGFFSPHSYDAEQLEPPFVGAIAAL